MKIDLKRLTHWGRATHICVGKLNTIDSDNGLSPGRRQAIIWTNAGILLIGPLRTNFSEILIGIQIFSFKKMHLKLSSAKWRPFVSASMSESTCKYISCVRDRYLQCSYVHRRWPNELDHRGSDSYKEKRFDWLIIWTQVIVLQH